MTTYTEFSDGEVCGCESGLLYVDCCKGRIAQYARNERGKVYRNVVLSPEAMEAIERARDDIELIFGRKPHDRDRLFLAQYRYSEEDIDSQFSAAAHDAGVRKEVIYASEKTRRILTEKTINEVRPAERQEWLDAVDEYLDAAEQGVDLLHNPWTSLLVTMQAMRTQIEHCVIHLGSYGDRAPKATQKNLSLFLQCLMIARCHGLGRAFADGFDRFMSDESFALLRSIYECSLLIKRVEVDPTFTEIMIAQSFAGSDLYPYRTRKNGQKDYSKVTSQKTQASISVRLSYLECAKFAGDEHENLYLALYPALTSHVHFDTIRMIQDYQDTGKFLSFQRPDPLFQASYALLIFAYLCGTISNVSGLLAIVKRDAKFLRKRCLKLQSFLAKSLRDEGLEFPSAQNEIRQMIERM